LNARIQSSILLVIIFLLVGTVVVFNSHSFSENDETITQVVSSNITTTEYVTRTVLSGATSTVFVTPAPSISSVSTVELTVTSTTTTTESQMLQQAVGQQNNYILIGGQEGAWFTDSQFPRLLQISLSNHTARKFNPVSGEGTVWGGGSNGSDWLISGWGTNNESVGPNPYFYVFNGTNALNNSVDHASETEWNGGDIFSISSNGSEWFVSGMGSGVLDSYSTGITNHLSAGVFNGTVFTDLSSELPQEMDGILYANAFGDNEWLVGGGYLADGVLFSFNGTSFSDLTQQISSSVPEFSSIQSIGWNGQYWLIGGMGFLAMYNDSVFSDLTPELNSVLPNHVIQSQYSVNALDWNGSSWLVGGGEAVALNQFSSDAWLASYNSSQFFNTSSALPKYTNSSGDSSILSIGYSTPLESWIIGGYVGSNGLLLSYDGTTSDLSNFVNGMNYVIWIGTS
jgi:hypothetical protein